MGDFVPSRLVFYTGKCDVCDRDAAFEYTSEFDHLFGVNVCEQHNKNYENEIKRSIRNARCDWLPLKSVDGCAGKTFIVRRSSGQTEPGWSIVKPGLFEACRASFRLSHERTRCVEVGLTNRDNTLVKYVPASVLKNYNSWWTPLYLSNENDAFLSTKHINTWEHAWQNI